MHTKYAKLFGGGAYGFGTGLTEGEDLSVKNALRQGAMGAATGGVLGAALPLAGKGIGKISNWVRGNVGRRGAYNQVLKAAGQENIEIF